MMQGCDSSRAIVQAAITHEHTHLLYVLLVTRAAVKGLISPTQYKTVLQHHGYCLLLGQ